MTRSLAIGEDITTFRQVQEKLGLILTEDRQFFTEWMAELPALSEAEQARLEQVRRNYLYQIQVRRNYLFIKTLGKQYGISDLFATRSPYRNNLYEVLRILKHLGRLIVRAVSG
jgi:hypothetical protein